MSDILSGLLVERGENEFHAFIQSFESTRNSHKLMVSARVQAAFLT